MTARASGHRLIQLSALVLGAACSSPQSDHTAGPDASSGGTASTGGASGSGGEAGTAGNAAGGTSGSTGSGGSAGAGAAATGGASGTAGTGDGGQGAPDGSAGAPSVPDGGTCSAPSSGSPVLLANFESNAIPSSSDSGLGFRSSDVARGTLAMPGANGTSTAASFSFASDDSLFFQSDFRPTYLDGSSSYDENLANALELYIRIPAGSSLLSPDDGSTFSIYTYHYSPSDPWVGPNPTGGNLTDSQMHGYGPMRFDPSGADQWLRVVMSASAFDHSRGNYHFYAAQAVSEGLTFFGSLRQFQPVYLADRSSGPTAVDLDEIRLVTLPPTAAVCPRFFNDQVAAGAGDVRVPVTIANPTSSARTYRVFASSVIGLGRQILEAATHDADAVSAVDNLQGAVGSDGGVGAVEIFADDGTGHPTGPSLIPQGGAGIPIPAGGAFRAVVVHHVTPSMLGSAQDVMNAGHTYSVRRDTLTTSVIVWDPSAPRLSDSAVVFTGSNADTSHPAPPGFPAYAEPPAGWRSTDVPPDQVAGYFVSVLRLVP